MTFTAEILKNDKRNHSFIFKSGRKVKLTEEEADEFVKYLKVRIAGAKLEEQSRLRR